MSNIDFSTLPREKIRKDTALRQFYEILKSAFEVDEK